MIGTRVELTDSYQLISSTAATVTIEERGDGAITFNTADAADGLGFVLDAGRQVSITSARNTYAKGVGYVVRVDTGV